MAREDHIPPQDHKRTDLCISPQPSYLQEVPKVLIKWQLGCLDLALAVIKEIP